MFLIFYTANAGMDHSPIPRTRPGNPAAPSALDAPAELDMSGFRLQSFAAGEAIFREGDEAGALYIVREGRVRLLKDKAGKPVVLGHLGPNALFGEMSAVDRKPRSATAIAAEPTVCFMVDIEQYEKRLGQLDPFMNALFRILVHCLRHTTEMTIKNSAKS